LIQQAVDGEKWTQFGAKKKITDKEMVDLSQKLHGWTQSVCSFGCGFIHLSRFHDYKDRDPFGKISRTMHDDIIRHMNQYHGWPINQDITFAELTLYIPMIFDKISSNLGCYLKDLEDGGVIN
jgi:hypothetical protein